MYRKIYKDALIIDVRDRDEHEQSSMSIQKKSINVPLNEIGKYMKKNRVKKDKQILVFCQSGQRSKTAYNLLIKLGYTNVIDLGGIDNANFIL